VNEERVDIGIYTSRDIFDEKKKYSEDVEKWVWWDIKSKPSKGEVERLFVAFNGKWQGYFTVHSTEPVDVAVKGDSSNKYSIFLYQWHELTEKISRTPFQGFTYNVPKVEEGE